ncbi:MULTISPECIES: CU044_5270 family protein [unclassified Nonomuraea]|uniref:CU044_5270 family protein n=1 Tax=unclassified Nonomuraea TaxID=2593643 RepID=UPI0033F90172
MDDLSAVRERCAVPGPSAETKARGRARLWALIEGEHAGSVLTEHVERSRRSRPTRAALWPALGTGLAGAAAAVTLVLSSAAPPPAAPPTRPSAQQILLAAATSAARQPADGDWWGNKIVRGVRIREPGGRYDLQVTGAEETWIPLAKQDTHWLVQRYLGARPATPRDEEAWRAGGSPTAWTYEKTTTGAATMVGADPDRLEAAPGPAESTESADIDWRIMFAGKPLTRMGDFPTDPSRLRAALEPKPRPTAALLGDLVSLILHVPVSPETRAAAYELMASLPGVTAQGEVADQLGRTGQAVAYTGPDSPFSNHEVRKRLIVDSTTGAPLAVETISPETGEIVRFTAVESSVWTDQRPDLPNPHPLDDEN